MSTKNVLVTGANGFIGSHVVRRLVARGDNVTCLVRQTSNLDKLQQLNCRIVYGDIVDDPAVVATAVGENDVVFHLAASTHCVHSADLVRINTTGLKNVLEACAARPSPATLIYVSSLAAVGASKKTDAHQEDAPRNPISFYGKSKAACEQLAAEYSDQVPISIIRPPVVLGDGDRRGLDIFLPIDQWGWHFVPSFSTNYFSVIHVDDLTSALLCVADRGRRLSKASDSDGVYFASADESVTYSRLGRMIGNALGRRRTRVVRVAIPLIWAIAVFNELKARLTAKPQFLNMDKFREINAGSWTCSNEKLKQELNWAPALPLADRLEQTAAWYRQHGWLSQKGVQPQAKAPQHVQDA